MIKNEMQFRWGQEDVIRVAIAAEALKAIVRCLFGGIGYRPEVSVKGECLIWLEPFGVGETVTMRGSGKIPRIAAAERGSPRFGGRGSSGANLRNRPICELRFPI
jgi:hypothetical protein